MSRRSNAIRVASGMFVTRLLGFVRTAMIARYLGVSAHADVWTAALRAPNILQNLLGEQTLSAAFIPTYSRMVEEGKEEEAGRFAGAIFGLLLAAAGGLALIGVVAARPIVAIFLAGFLGDGDGGLSVDRYELSVQAVRIIFPMTAVLVLSAWSLGVLNSHRRFFVPYVAPALWNLSMVATLVWVGEPLLRREALDVASLDRLVIATCWGALVGGLLQFAAQVPLVFRLLKGFRVSLSVKVRGVAEALRAFGPVVTSRGVVQLSSYCEQLLASFLVAGAVGALDYAQRLYLLPIGLFAMSVAAAELPELSRMDHADESSRVFRVVSGLRQMAFLTIPTAVGYLAMGSLVVGVIYERGSFSASDTWLVYLVLAGFSIGLLPSTSSRLLVNTFYSLGDMSTPARIAVIRVVVVVGCGAGLMIWLDSVSLASWVDSAEGGHRLGAVGLALGSALGSWLEWFLLYSRLRSRLRTLRLPLLAGGRMIVLAVICAALAVGADRQLNLSQQWIQSIAVLGLFASVYLVGAWSLGFPEPRVWIHRGGGE